MGESFSILAGGGKYSFKHFTDAKSHNETFHQMRMRKREVKKLFYKFRKWDKKNQRMLDVKDFEKLVDIESRGLSTRVFKVFDESNDGYIDFFEFVLGCWNYCTSTKQALALLAFDLYDSNAKGFIAIADMEDMMKDFYGSNYMSNRHAKEAIKKVAGMCNSHNPPRAGISVGEFSNFCRNHQNMLYSVFTLQRQLQKRTLGASKWKDIASRTANIRNNNGIGIKAKAGELGANRTGQSGGGRGGQMTRMSGAQGDIAGTLAQRRSSLSVTAGAAGGGAVEMGRKPRRGTQADDGFGSGPPSPARVVPGGGGAAGVAPGAAESSLLDFLDDVAVPIPEDVTFNEPSPQKPPSGPPTARARRASAERASASAQDVRHLQALHDRAVRRASRSRSHSHSHANLPPRSGPPSSRRGSAAAAHGGGGGSGGGGGGGHGPPAPSPGVRSRRASAALLAEGGPGSARPGEGRRTGRRGSAELSPATGSRKGSGFVAHKYVAPSPGRSAAV